MQQQTHHPIARACIIAGLLNVSGLAFGQDKAAASPLPFSLKPYGTIQLDASYDTQRSYDGDRAYYIRPKNAGVNDNEYNMTARATRLGLNLAGPDIDATLKTTGKVEGDFYGGGSANSANPRLRLGYLDLATAFGFSVRAGQDADTQATVMPTVLNGSTMNDAGNIVYRRPQLRATQEIKLTKDTQLIAKAAAARTIGEDIDGGTQDDGADSGTPTAQGNLILDTQLLSKKSTLVSVSGHYGVETLDTVVSNKITVDDSKNIDTWSVIGSLQLPLHDSIMLKGMVWQGANLDLYYGGVGQGINKTLMKGIEAKGGFAQLMVFLFDDKLNLNLGYGLDDPDDGDLNKNDRSKNEAIYTSAICQLTRAVSMGFEYTAMTTSYQSADNAADNRFQGSMAYKF